MNSTDSIGERIHAPVGWILIAILVLAGLASTVTDSLIWAGFVLVIAVIASLPALTRGNWKVMLPWPLLAIAALAALVRVAGRYREVAGYLAIVALALIIVIELDVFTSVELSRRFAIVFGVMTTMALEAVWIIAQHFSDSWLGTTLLRSQTELQWDMVVITVVAVVVALLYQAYATRFDPTGSISMSDSQGTR